MDRLKKQATMVLKRDPIKVIKINDSERIGKSVAIKWK